MHIVWLTGDVSVAKRTQYIFVIASSVHRHDQDCLNSGRKASYSPQAETRTFDTYSWKKRDGRVEMYILMIFPSLFFLLLVVPHVDVLLGDIRLFPSFP